MKSSIIALSVAAMLAFGVANAAAPAAATAAPAKAPTAQQTKMGACASANKGKKGADYKNAVSSCMKGGATAAPAAAAAAPATAPVAAAAPMAATAAAPAAAPAKTLTPQQQKMSDCSKANKGKKGAEYQTAQKACLSKK